MPLAVADGGDQVEVAHVAGELAHELGEVGALLGEPGDPAEAAGDVAAGDESGDLEERAPCPPRRAAPRRRRAVIVPAGERRELLERGDRVAHPAGGVARDERERGVGDVEALAVAMRRSRPTMSSMPMRRKSKRWQRDWIVSGTLCGCVVASTKTTWLGGSSSVLSSALNAAVESMWTSSMM